MEGKPSVDTKPEDASRDISDHVVFNAPRPDSKTKVKEQDLLRAALQSSKTPIKLQPLQAPTALQVPFGTRYIGSSPGRHKKGQKLDLAPIRQATSLASQPESGPARPTQTSQGTTHSGQQRTNAEQSDMAYSNSSSAKPDSEADGLEYMHDENSSKNLPGFTQIIGQPPLTPITPIISGFEAHHLRNELVSVRNASQITEAEVLRQKDVITHLTEFNEYVYGYIRELNGRLEVLEAENTRLVAERATPSSSRSGTASFAAPGRNTPSEPAAVNPGHHHVDSSDEIAEPDDDDYYETDPGSPVLPARSSKFNTPKKAAKSSPIKDKKIPHSMLHKRKVHNLNAMLPPAMCIIPDIPLTDKEIVVYLFSTLSRPVVSIRLYARGWGPAKMVEVLNAHRTIDPPYLRNTCSVKCTTAQKRGIERWGQDWDEDMRAFFTHADVFSATERIKVTEEECEFPVDIDLLDLAKGLKKHPKTEEDDFDSDNSVGIFTRCVRWCEEHHRSWPMSNVYKLAMSLEQGMTPEQSSTMSEAGTGVDEEDVMDEA